MSSSLSSNPGSPTPAASTTTSLLLSAETIRREDEAMKKGVPFWSGKREKWDWYQKQFRGLALKGGLLDVLDGTSSESDNVKATKNSRLYAEIILSIGQEIEKKVSQDVKEKDGEALWKALKTNAENAGDKRKLQVIRKLIECKKGLSVSQAENMIADKKDWAKKYKDLNITVEDLLRAVILDSLPGSLSAVRDALEVKDSSDLVDIERVVANKAEESRESESRETENEKLLYANSGKGPGKGGYWQDYENDWRWGQGYGGDWSGAGKGYQRDQCANCHGWGHWKNECPGISGKDGEKGSKEKGGVPKGDKGKGKKSGKKERASLAEVVQG